MSQLGKNLISCAFCGRWRLLLGACGVFQDGSSCFTPRGGGDADGDSERLTMNNMTRWLAFTAKVCFSVSKFVIHGVTTSAHFANAGTRGGLCLKV